MHHSPPLSGRTGLGAAATAAAPSVRAHLERLRELIAENDRALVRLLNRRLELVAEIWREKEAAQLPLTDPERERRLLRHLEETNDGPLSQQGLGVFHGLLLSLTKQELGR